MDLKVSRQTVQQATVNKLRAAILNGYFKPGGRLVEAELCRSMGVSRTSISEALRRLEAERLVTNVPNRGLSVASISWEEAEQIYQVRAMLEGEAMALFAVRASPEHLRTMRAALRDFEVAVNRNDSVARLEATTLFYDVMLAGCGNSVIAELLQGLVARINFPRAFDVAARPCEAERR